MLVYLICNKGALYLVKSTLVLMRNNKVHCLTRVKEEDTFLHKNISRQFFLQNHLPRKAVTLVKATLGNGFISVKIKILKRRVGSHSVSNFT